VKYDSKDKAYFANSGWEVLGVGEVLDRDWFFNSKLVDLSIFELSVVKYIYINKYLTMIPSFYMRITDGDDLPLYLATAIGGDHSVMQMPAQLPFEGLRNMQLLTQNATIFRTDFRFNVFKNNYITAMANVMIDGESLIDSSDNLVYTQINYPLIGMGLKYSYDSPTGPAELSIGVSNHSDRVNAFFSLGYWF
jgi:NTE family protein